MTPKNCRISNTPLVNVLNFGDQPLGNGFLSKENFSREYKFPMEIGFSQESLMLQLVSQPAPHIMFHDAYPFYSSLSKKMGEHFQRFADSVLSSSPFRENPDPFIVELGCNDGIFLKNFSSRGIRHLGVEPSENVALVANQSGVCTISKFFSSEVAEEIKNEHGLVDVFTAANVMCHIPMMRDVASGIEKILKPNGLLIFEDPYLGDIINMTSYDQIYDEHVFLFSGLSVQKLFGEFNMELIDVQHQKTHGGSMRYTIAKSGAYPIKDSVNNLLQQERHLGMHTLSAYEAFSKNVQKSRTELVSLIKKLKGEGKRIAGYGATSKSTTILNYCNLGPQDIDYICDTTPIKQGKFSPGMHIPVVPYEHFLTNPPDFAILFAWNHSEEIFEKEKEYSKKGGKWIFHVPNVRVV